MVTHSRSFYSGEKSHTAFIGGGVIGLAIGETWAAAHMLAAGIETEQDF
jgi:hypothetical protein